jgi:hypothetical protein
MSIGAAIIAILGLTLIWGGYWMVRDMDSAMLAAVCLKVAFGIGSTFLVVGLLAAFLPGDEISVPTGYFIGVGCICIPAFVKFPKYTRDR